MTRIRPAAIALAVTLFGTSIASAYPINNKTQTTIGVSTSGDLTIRRVDTGAFLQDQGGNNYNNRSTIAAVFSTKTTGPGAYGDPQVLVGKTFQTFCIELTGTLDTGQYDNSVIEKIPPATAAPNGVGYVESGSAAVLQRAAWVMLNAGNLISGTATEVAASTQLALWEILYDAGTAGAGDVNDYNRTAGGAYVASGGARGLKSTGSGAYSSAIRTDANTLLTASLGKTGAGLVFRQNIKYNPGTGQYEVLAGNGQTVMAAVPEPSTLAIAGLGALGFAAYGARRRRSS